ncbi:MAG: tRNA 2-thiocytidine(32) synthetase TtcA [Succinivibrio sp.]|nr:tRNA 2-thiocytidine(32) synthetase TtcA [Succinivibrio sp.]
MHSDNSLPLKTEVSGTTVNPAVSASDRQRKYNADKLYKRLRHHVGRAIGDYGMIEEGDKILVCMSGGKDSYAMLDLLLSLKRSAPVNFTLLPVHIESGFPGSPWHLLEDHLKRTGLEYRIVRKPVYELCRTKVKPGKPYCSMCSRLRRGFLYAAARELGANKVALGHHKDDALCTLFLNLFYGGVLKSMPAVLRTDSDDLTVIRPLIYCRERDLTKLSELKQYPLLPKGLCGFGEDEQRANMAKMIRSWDRNFPKRADIVFHAMQNVKPSHLFDKELFDFCRISNGPKIK